MLICARISAIIDAVNQCLIQVKQECPPLFTLCGSSPLRWKPTELPLLLGEVIDCGLLAGSRSAFIAMGRREDGVTGAAAARGHI